MVFAGNIEKQDEEDKAVDLVECYQGLGVSGYQTPSDNNQPILFEGSRIFRFKFRCTTGEL